MPPMACPVWLVLADLAALQRYQLFVYCDLYEWLDDPFQPPPALAPRRNNWC